MAAQRTQKRASASARGTAARRSGPRASSARSPRRAIRPRGKLIAIAVVASIIVAAWIVYPVFKLQYEHQREVRTLEEELASLQQRNGELRDEVEQLKTPEGVEEVARETLGLVKPGEQAYVVTGGTLGESTETVQPEEGGDRSVWQRVLDTLFGLD
ncbi:MAG: FtsB family cell division protein [Coriobacteriia bacterium]